MNITTAKWAAELKGVREVSLLGVADLTYWTQQLEEENLHPLEKEGRAQILIVAADAKFMGLCFKELSVSILVSPGDAGVNQQQAFLVHAFNSRRSFAFCERALFATPYYYGDVSVATSIPASIQVADVGTIHFRAEMNGHDATASRREPSRCADDGWEGAVFLPSSRARNDRQRRFFFVRIKGHTKSYPFLEQEDTCLIRSGEKHPVLESLIASQFVPTEWIIRANATHAKSKTYKKSDLLAVGAEEKTAGASSFLPAARRVPS